MNQLLCNTDSHELREQIPNLQALLIARGQQDDHSSQQLVDQLRAEIQNLERNNEQLRAELKQNCKKTQALEHLN